MKVSPELATEWLGYNTHNRSLRPSTVAVYAEAMEAGDWKNDIDPIAFAGSLTGRGKYAPVLLNGQHRLQGMVISGTTLELLVVEGLNIDDQAEMDAGVKRKLADQLRLNDQPYANELAAVLRLVWAYEKDNLRERMGNATHVTLLRFLADHPELPESVPPAARLRGQIGGRVSVFGAGHYIISCLDDPSVDDDLEEFFEKLADGNDLPANSPLLLYRNLMLSQSTARSSRRRMSQVTQLALFFKTWNAWRDGIALQSLSWRGGGKHPETFPTPE